MSRAKELFKEWCKSKGINGVNSHTVFRWDEVIEFGKYLHQSRVNAKDELIKWLNDECPHEDYDFFSHDFAELLRIKLDKLLKQ